MNVSKVNNVHNITKYEEGEISKENTLDFNSVIRQRIEYLEEKIKNGDTEVSYSIGASSFTEREWNKLMTKIDSIQDTMREMMREENEARKEEEEKVCI